MLWHPTKWKIQDWFDQKIREFAKKENHNPRLMMNRYWLEEYMHDGPHKYFFSEFLIFVYEWLEQLTYCKKYFQGGEETSWT